MEQNNLINNCTIKQIVPLFTIKDNVEANAIELIKFEENDFHVVVGKDLWKVGDKVQYILPDSNLKEGNTYLNDYLFPTDKEGKPISTKLGSNGRVKAIGFNFSTGDFQKVYSNGIIIPISEDIQKFVYKYEAPESSNLKTSGGGEFPEGFYRTSETNFKLSSNTLEFPCTLSVTHKTDGSSCSLFVREINGKLDKGICSRNLRKDLIQKIQVGVDISFIGRLFKLVGLDIPKRFITPIYEERPSNDDFVLLGLDYLDKLEAYWYDLKTMLPRNVTGVCLRAEATGSKFKGSGNKNNVDAVGESRLEVFGFDLIENGFTVKKTLNVPLLESLGFKTVTEYYNKEFKSKEELLFHCEEIFKENKNEGVVIRKYENGNVVFSSKVLSDLYDSKK